MSGRAVRYLGLDDVLILHRAILEQAGGKPALRDLGGLLSALAQPRMTFGSADLYPTLQDKAAALGFSLIRNHSFVDGNKRIGHAAMECFLRLNGLEILADVDASERLVVGLASGEISREQLVGWLHEHTHAR